MERVADLEPAYRRAREQVISGSSFTVELLVQPVETARERAKSLFVAWERAEASEDQVIDAYIAVARLMSALTAAK